MSAGAVSLFGPVAAMAAAYNLKIDPPSGPPTQIVTVSYSVDLNQKGTCQANGPVQFQWDSQPWGQVTPDKYCSATLTDYPLKGSDSARKHTVCAYQLANKQPSSACNTYIINPPPPPPPPTPPPGSTPTPTTRATAPPTSRPTATSSSNAASPTPTASASAPPGPAPAATAEASIAPGGKGGGDATGCTSQQGRHPTAAELSQWEATLGGTGTDQQLLIAILGSPEYYAVAGGNDAGFIDRVYLDTVRRVPAPAEIGEAQAIIVASPTGRTTLATNLVLGPEYMSRYVVAYYQHYLGRPPTALEENQGLLVLPHPGSTTVPPATSVEQFGSAIVGSPEYLTRAGGTPEGFFSHAWTDTFNSAATPADATPYAADLAVSGAGAQAARTRVALALLSSRRYRDDVITSTYITTLYRPCPALPQVTRCATTVRHPTAAELHDALQAFSTGGTEEALVIILVGSDEYYFNHGGGSQAAFVDGVYSDLLDRHPTSEEAAAAISGNTNDHAGHHAFVQHLMQGEDYQLHLVDGWYHQFVFRSPSLDERVAAHAILGGTASTTATPDENEIASIMSTDEYYRQAEGYDFTFARHVYGDLLLAPLPSDLETRLLAPTPHDTAWRAGVAHAILGSPEYRTAFINGAYEKYLSRLNCAPVPAPAGFVFPGGVPGLALLGLILLGGAGAVFWQFGRGGHNAIGSDEHGTSGIVDPNQPAGLQLGDTPIATPAAVTDGTSLKGDDKLGSDDKLGGDTSVKMDDTSLKIDQSGSQVPAVQHGGETSVKMTTPSDGSAFGDGSVHPGGETSAKVNLPSGDGSAFGDGSVHPGQGNLPGE